MDSELQKRIKLLKKNRAEKKINFGRSRWSEQENDLHVARIVCRDDALQANQNHMESIELWIFFPSFSYSYRSDLSTSPIAFCSAFMCVCSAWLYLRADPMSNFYASNHDYFSRARFSEQIRAKTLEKYFMANWKKKKREIILRPYSFHSKISFQFDNIQFRPSELHCFYVLIVWILVDLALAR